MTRDVAAGLHVSFEEADELIMEYGISEEYIKAGPDEIEEGWTPREGAKAQIKLKTAVHGAPAVVAKDEMDVIVYERARELLMKVRQHLQSRGLAKHLIRGVVLTGGAATVKNHVKLAETIFEVPCRIGLSSSVEILSNRAKGPEFSGVVGIALHGFNYRAAARAGRLALRGPVVQNARKLGQAFRKYFF